MEYPCKVRLLSACVQSGVQKCRGIPPSRLPFNVTGSYRFPLAHLRADIDHCSRIIVVHFFYSCAAFGLLCAKGRRIAGSRFDSIGDIYYRR